MLKQNTNVVYCIKHRDKLETFGEIVYICFPFIKKMQLLFIVAFLDMLTSAGMAYAMFWC